MADTLTKSQRRYCMSRIRSKYSSIERTIFDLLKQNRIKFTKHFRVIGTPDIAFPKVKLAVFLDSDFWHGWRFKCWRKRLPVHYWQAKILENIRRDQKNKLLLKKMGWRVLRLWEHQIKSNPQKCLGVIVKELKKRPKATKP